MLTQISLMPASRRCFGGAHRALCLPRPCVPNTELCVPSKHARHVAALPLIPSVVADSPPLRICATGQPIPFGAASMSFTVPENKLSLFLSLSLSLSLPITFDSETFSSSRLCPLSFFRSILGSGLSQGTPRVPANTRARSIASALFARHPYSMTNRLHANGIRSGLSSFFSSFLFSSSPSRLVGPSLLASERDGTLFRSTRKLGCRCLDVA